MKSLILFGDSHLGRFGRRWMKKVEENIKKVIVYNFAAGGLYASDGIKQAPLVSKLKPNYILMSFGGNDATRPKEITPKIFEKEMNAVVDYFKGSKVILFPCPPERSKETDLVPYNNALKNVAKNKKVDIIDSEKIYGDLLKNNQDYHEDDGIHFNDLGYDILVKELVKKIK